MTASPPGSTRFLIRAAVSALEDRRASDGSLVLSPKLADSLIETLKSMITLIEIDDDMLKELGMPPKLP